MSRSELKRFQEDVRQDPALLEELRERVDDPEAALQWASARGYGFSREELEELRESCQELTDEELDQAAGGDDGWGTGTPPPDGGG